MVRSWGVRTSMRFLIVGASGPESIGTLVGEWFRNDGHEVLLCSRSGASGASCDCTDIQAIRMLVVQFQPDTIIHAAGCWGDITPLGTLTTLEYLRQNLLAKGLGVTALLDAALRVPTVRDVVVLGGALVSSDPRFLTFTLGNHAAWGAVQFARRHTTLRAHYLEMPTVWPSTMARSFGVTSCAETMQTPEEVYTAVRALLEQK